MAFEDDVPAQWDDELSSWPNDDRHATAKRVAFVTVCGILVMLIILTLLFVGNDKKSSAARVTTNVTSSSTSATTVGVGFVTSLPVAATATSFGTTTSSSDTTTTSLDTTLTTGTTGTTAPPSFLLNPTPRVATATMSGGQPGCAYASPNDTWVFDTKQPGVLTITHVQTKATGSGQILPDGTFGIIAASAKGAADERYTGKATQARVIGTFSIAGCAGPANANFTFQ